MNIGTEILIIGGGATGLSAARDALLRGFKTVVLEKGDLAHGTSGRYHGLLHSGGRYVNSDPQSARECYSENLILRRLLPSALEDTGGLFITTPFDPPEYADEFLAACQACGIPAEEIAVAQALEREPLLNPAISRAIRVPDAACDSFDALHILAAEVRDKGGEVFLRHRVEELLVENDTVRGVVAHDLTTGEQVRIYADLVLNCAGAWAGEIAALAGCKVDVLPSKGTMIATNMRLTNTVLNRCKPPHDGDILVPVGTVSIIGTTEITVESADQYPFEEGEIDLLLEEGEKMIPGFRAFRPLRAWAGVRPLYAPPAAEEGAEDTRSLSRSHFLINHRTAQGVHGLLSIVGGKFTTMRLMAEQLVDLACTELEVERPCVTATTPLEPPDTPYYTLPQRLRQIEGLEGEQKSNAADPLICECELVSQSRIEVVLESSDTHILNDLRRDTRLGMGPCQAGFCAYRAAGLAQQQLGLEAAQTTTALAQFLQERWKGQRPLLWGQNLRQLELDLHIYSNLLGLDRLVTAQAIEAYPTEKTS